MRQSFRRLIAVLHSDSGTVSITFILTLPIFLTIIAIMVQYALLLNARLLVQHAAETAARSAITAVPDGHSDAVWRAARISLVTLSPKAGIDADAEALAVADALGRCGVNITASFPARYTYAEQAAKVRWTGGDWSRSPGREVDLTINYEFLLTVPGAARILSARQDTVAGVKGRFFTISGAAHAEATDGRKAGAGGTGWPN